MVQEYVLFVGGKNRFRSIAAEALFNENSEEYLGISAGIQKTDNISPAVIEVMKERGIDVSEKKPQLYTFELLKNAAKVITFGCEGGVCLPFPADDWNIEDPEGKNSEEQKQIIKVIEKKVKELVGTLESK